MTNNRVEEILVEGLKQLIKKYDWLEVRYEYSEERGVFLVSYGPKSETSGSEDFALDAIAFEDRVNDLFGDDAPLFCNGEELFELSPSAHIQCRCLCSIAESHQQYFREYFCSEQVSVHLLQANLSPFCISYNKNVHGVLHNHRNTHDAHQWLSFEQLDVLKINAAYYKR